MQIFVQAAKHLLDGRPLCMDATGGIHTDRHLADIISVHDIEQCASAVPEMAYPREDHRYSEVIRHLDHISVPH